MEMNLEQVKEALTSNRKQVISLAKQLEKANSLNRTLLTALSDTISRDDVISYDDRKALKRKEENMIDYLNMVVPIPANANPIPVGKVDL